MTQAILMCPKCESLRVDWSPVIGSKATCRSCGHVDDVQNFPARTMDVPEGVMDIISKFSYAVTQIMKQGSFPMDVAHLLLGFGFLEETANDFSSKLPRYLSEIAKAMAIAIIKTSDDIAHEAEKAEKEDVRQSS